MPEFLEYGFMHRAFVAGAITALICPAIGVFLVPRRLSLIADSLSHVALAGVALGLLIGVSPVLGALVVTVAGAVGMERLRAQGALQGDAALAVFLSGGVPVAGLNLLLTVLTALTTVVAMRMVGVLLVSAMIVIPTLTGFGLGRSFRQATVIAIAMALTSMTSGLIAAYYLRLAAGGAVVLTALIIFALASL